VSELSDADFLTAYYRNLLRYAARHRAKRLRLIGGALRWSLRVRGTFRPGRRNAYISAAQNLLLSPPSDVA
jgi:hypothetical protein